MMSYDRMHIDERAACASLAARAFMDYEFSPTTSRMTAGGRASSTL